MSSHRFMPETNMTRAYDESQMRCHVDHALSICSGASARVECSLPDNNLSTEFQVRVRDWVRA